MAYIIQVSFLFYTFYAQIYLVGISQYETCSYTNSLSHHRDLEIIIIGQVLRFTPQKYTQYNWEKIWTLHTGLQYKKKHCS